VTISFPRPQRDPTAEHGIVYRNESQFCAWPFYCGFWQVANGDIVASFKRVETDYSAAASVDHGQMSRKKGHLVTIRSRDGGRSWDPGSVQEIFDMDAKGPADFPGGTSADWSGLPPLDFTSRDTLVMGGGVPSLFAPDADAWLRASSDGGKSWRDPIILPRYGLPSLTHFGLSQYGVREDGVALMGMQSVSPEALSPRPLVYGTKDGWNWQFLDFMTEQEAPSPFYVSDSPFAPLPHFYPRIVMLKSGKAIASLRYQRDARSVIWTEVMESLDGGRSWHFLSRLNDWGAPGDLVPMADGRLVCVYGCRIMPSGVRYRVSEDEGRTWSGEFILRDDGGSWDVGYPRVIEAEPGTLLSVYYINLAGERVNVNGGVRHIAWTRFRP